MKSSTSRFIVSGISASLAIGFGIFGVIEANKEIEREKKHNVLTTSDTVRIYAKWLIPCAVHTGITGLCVYGAVKELKAERMASAMDGVTITTLEPSNAPETCLDVEFCGVTLSPKNERGQRLMTVVAGDNAGQPEDYKRKVFLVKELEDATCDLVDFDAYCINYAPIETIKGFDTTNFNTDWRASSTGAFEIGSVGNVF